MPLSGSEREDKTARRERESAPSGSSSAPSWPTRLMELAREIRAASDPADRDRFLGEVWVILNTRIRRSLRIHGARLRPLPREEEEEIAAQRSLDLVRKLAKGDWEVDGRHPAEVAGFLSRVARNGLIDYLREQKRWKRVDLEDPQEPSVSDPRFATAGTVEESPHLGVESREFSRALRRCAERLPPPQRKVWFLRVFCQMSSKEIAAHPEVRLQPGHVDVLLQRGRQRLKEEMMREGFDPEEIPAGAFLEIWKAFWKKPLADPGGRDE